LTIQFIQGVNRNHVSFYTQSLDDAIDQEKGIKRASSDVGLMFIAFNLRRMMNIIDKNEFKKFLKEIALIFSKKTILSNVFCIDLRPSNLNTQLFTSLFKAA